MTSALPDLDDIRGVLRGWCCEELALDGLRAAHVSARPNGWVRVLYEGRRADGNILRVAARSVGAVKGQRLEAEINGRDRARHRGGFAQPALHDPGLGLLFQVFPADLRMPSLPVAADAAAMAPVLERVLGRGAAVRDVSVEAVRYKPEQKCLFRYEISWAGAGAAELPRVVYGKVARPSTFHRVRHTLRCLGGASGGVAFDLPASLGVVPDLCMELMSCVPGVRLDTLAERADFASLCAQAGVGLRRFHRLGVVLGHEPDPTEAAARLADAATKFALLCPAERARIATACDELTARLAAEAPARPRPTHGDFHAGNVLVDGTRLGLIDFEDCHMGVAADDVGSFCAQLTWRSISTGSHALQDGRRAFLETYLDDADAETVARLRLHTALQCFLYAYQCARHPEDASLRGAPEVMLGACERALEASVVGEAIVRSRQPSQTTRQG